MLTLTSAEIIEAAIRNEEKAMLAATPAERAEFWCEWDAEAVRLGTVYAHVTTEAPGNGHVTRVTARLLVRDADGRALASAPFEHFEKVSTRAISRRNGTEGYAHRLAAKLYGAEVPVKYTNIV